MSVLGQALHRFARSEKEVEWVLKIGSSHTDHVLENGWEAASRCSMVGGHDNDAASSGALAGDIQSLKRVWDNGSQTQIDESESIPTCPVQGVHNNGDRSFQTAAEHTDRNNHRPRGYPQYEMGTGSTVATGTVPGPGISRITRP